MRSWAPGLLLALLAAAPALADEPPVMVLDGDVSALYTNGDFVVWNPKPAGRGSMMTAATAVTKPGDKPPSIESTLDIVAKAPIGPDGRFRLEAVADDPRRVYFYVLNAVSPEGHRMAPVKGNGFILEAGELKLTMSNRGRFAIEGGAYNDAVYNTWRLSDDYKAAQAD